MWVVRTKALSPRCEDASCSKCSSHHFHHPLSRRPAVTCFTQCLLSRGPPDSRVSEAKPQHCLLSQLGPLHTVTLGGYSTTPSSWSCYVPPLPWPHAAGHSPCPENTGLVYIRKAGQTCVLSNGDYVVALPCLGPALWLGDLWLSKKPTPASRGESNFLFDIRILRVK